MPGGVSLVGHAAGTTGGVGVGVGVGTGVGPGPGPGTPPPPLGPSGFEPPPPVPGSLGLGAGVGVTVGFGVVVGFGVGVGDAVGAGVRLLDGPGVVVAVGEPNTHAARLMQTTALSTNTDPTRRDFPVRVFHIDIREVTPGMRHALVAMKSHC